MQEMLEIQPTGGAKYKSEEHETRELEQHCRGVSVRAAHDLPETEGDTPPPHTTKRITPSAAEFSGLLFARRSRRAARVAGFLPARTASANAAFLRRISNSLG
jgi:hypothetical protein